jgi:hypothetical protein
MPNAATNASGSGVVCISRRRFFLAGDEATCEQQQQSGVT